MYVNGSQIKALLKTSENYSQVTVSVLLLLSMKSNLILENMKESLVFLQTGGLVLKYVNNIFSSQFEYLVYK